MSRVLPVWLLALFVSAGALTLHTTPSANTSLPDTIFEGEPWSFWSSPAPQKRALLIIHGLLRTVAFYWPKLQRNFVAPNTEAGYDFTIVLHTSLSVNCSGNDLADENRARCGAMLNFYGNTTEERQKKVTEMFAGYDFQLVDAEDPCWTSPTDRDRSTTEYLKGRWRNAGCSGTIHFSSRGTQALDSFRGKKGFDRVALIRTDNCFELQGYKKQDKQVMLDEACTRHPGANIVGNLNYVPIPYGKDYDHAWMLCDGSKAHVFREALAAFGLTCQGPVPQCPEGFCLGSMPGNSNLCESASILERGGLKFGTLDDYMIANYQLENGTVQLTETEALLLRRD